MKKLVKISLLLATVLTSTSAYAAAEKYTIDKSHTSILFFVNHLGFSDMIGKFTDYDGTLMLDEKSPEKSTVDVTIRPASIATSSTELDKHLQDKEWFDSAKYPEIRFVSKTVTKTSDTTADILGDLTMHGVTKPVTLKARLNKADYFEMAKAWIAGFNAEATIKRSDFGISNYVPMVGDEVQILISTEFHNKEKAAPASAAADKKKP